MNLKCLLIAGIAFALSTNVIAQDDKNLFNHLSVGVTAGTPGIGLDVAMPIGNYVQVRAGAAFMPSIKVNKDFDINISEDARKFFAENGYDAPETVEVEGKVGFTNGKLLFDIYPFKNSGFHLTAGAYIGSSKVVKLYNKENGFLKPISEYNKIVREENKLGVELGDYLLEPDEHGNMEAKVKTAGFKPYLGLGYGRAVPKKRVGFMVELGCQFWGTPKVYCMDKELTENDVDGKDGGIMKTLSKVTVYPVLNFRLCGKIF